MRTILSCWNINCQAYGSYCDLPTTKGFSARYSKGLPRDHAEEADGLFEEMYSVSSKRAIRYGLPDKLVRGTVTLSEA